MAGSVAKRTPPTSTVGGVEFSIHLLNTINRSCQVYDDDNDDGDIRVKRKGKEERVNQL